MSARAKSAGIGICLLVAALCGTVDPLAGQGRPEIRVERADGSFTGVQVEMGGGFAAVPLALFTDLGWQATLTGPRTVALRVPGEIEVELRLGSAFFRWDGVVLQMTHAPFVRGGETYLPLQLLTDFFPRRLPDLYEYEGPTSTLRAGDPSLLARASVPAEEGPAPQTSPDEDVAVAPVPETDPETAPPAPYEGPRVVVIDAGHGGEDPGAMGVGGIREKTVALAIALRLADELEGVPDLEVYMTRDDDTYVEIWERGEIATDYRGDRPGVFLSIHANSFPARRAARGFETYFLSEARTEHERRVAAIENASLSFQGQDLPPEDEPDLDAILRDLGSRDHLRWSAVLAELVQDELDDFHPGPNRGVKQGVLAVLTNTLMPSVLIEVGYISNAEEGRLLSEEQFHQSSAEAIAEAVLRFFEQYPPGSGSGNQERP